MIEVWSWPTPNGHKVHIALEELGLQYEVITRGYLDVDDHLVIIGPGGVGGSAVHIAPAAVAGQSNRR